MKVSFICGRVSAGDAASNIRMQNYCLLNGIEITGITRELAAPQGKVLNAGGQAQAALINLYWGATEKENFRFVKSVF